eukprot:CAMPEP_0170597888 /NCGR_PEP_ID=MMETSP0224-20130122/15948_1 /TAXON_ID=285029 /ORGANISM="Togula jolla, Strain CCCM 725" /LENGTH=247 /DNA_ID=CAMNT_0010922391 /DNA_START=1005 /DNA_END=1749 /DNA_ORIENTATION=-
MAPLKGADEDRVHPVREDLVLIDALFSWAWVPAGFWILQPARWSARKGRRFVHLEEIQERLRVALHTIVRKGPRVVGVPEEVQGRLIATSCRSVLWSCSPGIPLTHVVRSVASTLHDFGYTCHVARHARKATQRILRVMRVQGRICNIGVDRGTATLDGDPSWAAHVVGVHATELHALLGKAIDHWRSHLPRRDTVLLTHIANVGKSKIISQYEEHVRFLFLSRTAAFLFPNSEKTGFDLQKVQPLA